MISDDITFEAANIATILWLDHRFEPEPEDGVVSVGKNDTLKWLKGLENTTAGPANNYKRELERIEDMGQIKWPVNCIERIVHFSLSEMNETFTNVVNEIIKLPGFNFYISSDDSFRIKKLIEEFKKEKPPLIDYDEYWSAFNQSYFFKNLYKAFATIKYLQVCDLIELKPDSTVIDVGCGAGVYTIAWNILFDKHKSKHILIDRNKFQLGLARRITKIFNDNIFEFHNASFPDDFDQLHGIRLFSYYFCEQEDYSRFLDANNLSKMIGEGALIIDYRYIIDRLENITNSKFKFTRWTIKVEKLPQILVEKDKKGQYIYGAYIKP